MISIEQWRGRIGSFYRVKVHCIVSHTKATPFTSSALFLSLIQAMMSAAVISILLIIGGVESNPGPPVVTPNGEFSTKLLQSISNYAHYCVKHFVK